MATAVEQAACAHQVKQMIANEEAARFCVGSADVGSGLSGQELVQNPKLCCTGLAGPTAFTPGSDKSGWSLSVFFMRLSLLLKREQDKFSSA